MPRACAQGDRPPRTLVHPETAKRAAVRQFTRTRHAMRRLATDQGIASTSVARRDSENTRDQGLTLKKLRDSLVRNSKDWPGLSHRQMGAVYECSS